MADHEINGGVGGEEPSDATDAMSLAREHELEAVRVLVRVMRMQGPRAAGTAAAAAKSIVAIARPDMDLEHVKSLVEDRLRELIAEAEQRRLGPSNGHNGNGQTNGAR